MKTITAQQAKEISEFKEKNPVEWHVQKVFNKIIAIVEDEEDNRKYNTQYVIPNRELTEEQCGFLCEVFTKFGFCISYHNVPQLCRWRFIISWKDPKPAKITENQEEQRINTFATS